MQKENDTRKNFDTSKVQNKKIFLDIPLVLPPPPTDAVVKKKNLVSTLEALRAESVDCRACEKKVLASLPIPTLRNHTCSRPFDL